MGIYTRFTRRWLEERYQRKDESGVHLAHQPLFGRGRQGFPIVEHNYATARHFQILTVLAELDAESLLDVGASEGLLCHHARELFGMKVMGSDLSAQSCARAAEFLGVHAVACDSARLPFRDGAFDVVVCSEVLEHVEFPVETILELQRVAKKALIVTSDEVRLDWEAVSDHRAPFFPHVERNLFHVDDFKAILDPAVRVRAQAKGRPPEQPVPDEVIGPWMIGSIADPTLRDGTGALILDLRDPAALRSPKKSVDEILRAVLRPACAHATPLSRSLAWQEWTNHFRCPETGGALEWDSDALVSAAHRYPLQGGVPELYVANAPDPTAAELQARLQRLWPSDADRVATVMRIRHRLESREPTPVLAWTFANPADREEFLLAQDLVESAASPWTLTSTGADPALLGPPVVYPRSGLAGFEFELAHELPDETHCEAQFYWVGPFDHGFEEARSVRIPLENGSAVHRYRVHLETPPYDGAEAIAFLFRFDPLDGPGVFQLKSFRFLPR